jgi:hypothetical protein
MYMTGWHWFRDAMLVFAAAQHPALAAMQGSRLRTDPCLHGSTRLPPEYTAISVYNTYFIFPNLLPVPPNHLLRFPDSLL